MNSGQEKIFKTHQLNDVDDCVRSIKSVIEKTKKLPKSDLSDFVRHVLSCSVLAFNDLLDELGYTASVQKTAITKQHNSYVVKKIST